MAIAPRRNRLRAGALSVTQADAQAKKRTAAAKADGTSDTIPTGMRRAANDAPTPMIEPIQATRSGNR